MLLYHGSPGIGKTYFCSAIAEWALQNFDSIRYHHEKNLLARLRQGISDGSGDYERNLGYLIDDELVILDDVGSGINPNKCNNRDLEWRREIFFGFLDYRYNSMKPTIITSNFTQNDFMEIYSGRICSRLFANENTIISVFGDDLDKRQKGL